jgi:CheY-like chemotaxis protein
MPGLQVIARLRTLLPGVVIIALSVMNTPDFRKAALAAGANAFVSKARLRADLMPTLRQLVDAAHISSQPVKCPPREEPKGSAPSVLVIEDDAYLRRLYSRVLYAAGYTTFAAATIEEACSLLAQV